MIDLINEYVFITEKQYERLNLPKNQIEELKKLRDELANQPKLLEDAEAEVRIKEFLLKERHNLKELLQF